MRVGLSQRHLGSYFVHCVCIRDQGQSCMVWSVGYPVVQSGAESPPKGRS